MTKYTCDQHTSSISRSQTLTVLQKRTCLRDVLLEKVTECTAFPSFPSAPIISAQLHAVMSYMLGVWPITHFGRTIRNLAPAQHCPRNAWYKLRSWFTSRITDLGLKEPLKIIWSSTTLKHSQGPVQFLTGPRMKVSYKK